MDNLNIKKENFDINLKYYFFLKYLIKAKLTERQSSDLLKYLILNKKHKIEDKKLELGVYIPEHFESVSKKDNLLMLIDIVESNLDYDLLIFSLKLYSIKDILLQEAKTKDLLDTDKINDLDPLSLEYDRITTMSPYSTRVSGALLSSVFFNKAENNEIDFSTEESTELLKDISDDILNLQKKGIEAKQIFMLMFTESMNQSIISDSGSNYEERIHSVLVGMGINADDIEKNHDKNDSSTEFDFFFEINGRSYGIGAKRTLRERYKQFIKTAKMSKIDVMIEITLGTDIREKIAQSIVDHGVYLFVSDEVHDSKDFLKTIKGVYPAREFNLDTLKKL